MKILKKYFSPVPIKWRAIGDIILICGITITSSYLASSHQWLEAVALVLTITGKILTNLPSEEKK